MEAYEGFASVYDKFMGDTDYEKWVRYIQEIWKKDGLTPIIVAELGCGTGNVTGLLAKEGIEMIGIDISDDMLSEARKKAEKEQLDILYLCQDMREFELYGTVNCVLSLYDSLNYITEEADLFEVFKLVNNYLHPKGLFIFDLNTEYKFENILAQNTFAQTTDDAAYIWENFYDKDEKINEFYMNFFKLGKDEKTYERVEEFHYERAYELDTIKNLIGKSGMEFVGAYDAFTFNSPKFDSQRIYVVAREIMKKECCNIKQEEQEDE